MNLKFAAILVVVLLAFLGMAAFKITQQPGAPLSINPPSRDQVTAAEPHPLQILEMRKKEYPGSDLAIEQTLAPGSNYNQYMASYQSYDSLSAQADKSEGLKVYGLLTVPQGNPPAGGWPVIIFNHGYIPPTQYRTTERYVAYVDGFARNGYIVFKPDFRGNGSSEGEPEGAYYSPAYTVDVLNALASLKKYPNANPAKIGMWGHSMGGNITLRSLVISPDIKVAVIWGGVVGTYDDLMNNWQRKVPFQPSQRELVFRNRNRANLIAKYGTPQANPDFWHAIDPNFNLQYLQAPVQLNAGGSDEEVPVALSEGLDKRLKQAGKTVEFYTYPGADHNISGAAFNLAMERSIEFFNKYLK